MWFLFGFDISCGIWPSARLGSVSKRPPAKPHQPPGLLLINGSWKPRLLFVLGGRTVRNGKPPRARGRDPGQHGAAPAQDGQALNRAEPFPLLGRAWMPRFMDSETSARAPLPLPAPLQGTSSLTNVTLCICGVCAVLSCFSCVRLFVTPWTVARQAPLSMGFSRQEYWSELPGPPPGDLPNPGIKS